MRSTISIVVAMNSERVIGVNNHLPWHIPEDLKHFKQCTLNKTIIMGRKTLESIGRILPQRKNVIISNTLKITDIKHIIKPENIVDEAYIKDNVAIYQSLDLAISNNIKDGELCIIGGGEIFKLSLPFVNKIYLTLVDIDLVDLSLGSIIKFPQIDMRDWRIIKHNTITTSLGIKCDFQDLVRIR